MFAKIHLFTLQGMFMTTSLYPSVPSPIPAPGVANWVAYMIPDAPFFGLKFGGKGDADGSDGGDVSNQGIDVSNTMSTPDVKKKPKPIVSPNILSNGDADGLSTTNKEDEIDDALIADLNSDSVNSLNKILEAEREKDLAGLERFYSSAIQAIGDFKNIQPDTDAQFKKSLGELQKQLEEDKNKCCDDCD